MRTLRSVPARAQPATGDLLAAKLRELARRVRDESNKQGLPHVDEAVINRAKIYVYRPNPRFGTKYHCQFGRVVFHGVRACAVAIVKHSANARKDTLAGTQAEETLCKKPRQAAPAASAPAALAALAALAATDPSQQLQEQHEAAAPAAAGAQQESCGPPTPDEPELDSGSTRVTAVPQDQAPDALPPLEPTEQRVCEYTALLLALDDLPDKPEAAAAGVTEDLVDAFGKSFFQRSEVDRRTLVGLLWKRLEERQFSKVARVLNRHKHM